MNTIYVIHPEFNILCLISLLLITVTFISIKVFINTVKSNKENKKYLEIIVPKSVVEVKMFMGIVFLIIITAYIIIYNVISFTYIYNSYKNGNYCIENGIVENFTEQNSGKENVFTVNETIFSFSDDTYWGYRKTLLNGGAIKENGQKVSICYIPYKSENIIVELNITDQGKH